IAPNHQVAVYTHTDKNHYHNHIVINSIDLDTGNKYQSNKKQRELVKRENDNICHSHGLSVPEKQRETRYTQAEYEIGKEAQKGNKPIPWKEQIRMVIDQTQATSHEELNQDLLQNGMKIERITDKTITYKHLEEDKKVRGSKLGEKYDKGGVEYGFDGRIKRQKELEQSKPIERKQSDQREREWEDFARTTSSIEQDRKRREQEKSEMEYGIDGRIKRQKKLEQAKPIERKKSDKRERDWEDFARKTSSIEQDRKRREQEKRERVEEKQRIEAENRRAREERERE